MILNRLFADAVPNRDFIASKGDQGGAWMNTAAGERVDEITALNLSGVWRCCTVITNDVKKLPWHVFEKVGATRVLQVDHDLNYIISVEPNPEMDSCTFREVLQIHALLSGNGYAEIERNYYGDVVALWPINSFNVTPKRRTSGQLYYEVRNAGGGAKELPPENIFHLKGLGLDGISGIGVISNARETIGGGFALQKAGNSFFRNGFRPSGVLEHPGTLSDTAFEHLRSSFTRMYAGAGNTGKPIIAEEGMKWTQLSMNLADAQFLGSHEFNLQEIARWFGVKSYKLGIMVRETHSNIFQNAQEHIDETILPWILKWEMEARRKFFGPTKKTFYTKFDFRGMLRGDPAARGAFYKDMATLGAYSINEIRANEDEDPIDPKLGNARIVPMNMMTLEQMVEGKSLSQPKTASAAKIIESVFARSLRKEEKAISRKGGKQNTPEWADLFYSEIASELRDNLEEVAEPALKMAGMQYKTEKADGFINRYVSEGSQSAIAGIDLHTDFPSETARKFIEAMI